MGNEARIQEIKDLWTRLGRASVQDSTLAAELMSQRESHSEIDRERNAELRALHGDESAWPDDDDDGFEEAEAILLANEELAAQESVYVDMLTELLDLGAVSTARELVCTIMGAEAGILADDLARMLLERGDFASVRAMIAGESPYPDQAFTHALAIYQAKGDHIDLGFAQIIMDHEVRKASRDAESAASAQRERVGRLAMLSKASGDGKFLAEARAYCESCVSERRAEAFLAVGRVTQDADDFIAAFSAAESIADRQYQTLVVDGIINGFCSSSLFSPQTSAFSRQVLVGKIGEALRHKPFWQLEFVRRATEPRLARASVRTSETDE